MSAKKILDKIIETNQELKKEIAEKQKVSTKEK